MNLFSLIIVNIPKMIKALIIVYITKIINHIKILFIVNKFIIRYPITKSTIYIKKNLMFFK